MLRRHAREQAVALLGLASGDRVVDVGCGTGRSLGRLREAVGDDGTVVGVEQDARKARAAAQRAERCRWQNTRVIRIDAVLVEFGEPVDAALFCLTPQLLRSPDAVLNVLRQLRPRARVVGLLDARPNLVIRDSWALLTRYLTEFDVAPLCFGRFYVGHGAVPPSDVRPG